MVLKLKVIESNEDFIAVELPKDLFIGKPLPEYVILKNFSFE